MRLSYGWAILGIASLIYATLNGPIVAFGVFIKPMAEELAWTRTATIMVFGTFLLTNGALATITGHLADRFGARIMVFVGGSLLGLGLFLSSRVNALWQFYLFYGLIQGIGLSCIFAPLMATITQWFTSRTGLALGVFYCAGSVGGLVMAPVIQSLVTDHGWRTTYVIVAVLAWCAIIPSALFLKRKRSHPASASSNRAESIMRSAQTGQSTQTCQRGGTQDRTLVGAVRTNSLWVFCTAILFVFTGIMMAQVNMVPYATDIGISATIAAMALGISSAFNAIGRLAMGTVSDRLGTKRALFSIVLLACFALFWLIAVRQPWMLFLFAVPFGFAYGGFLPQVPRVLSELFGTKSLGAIFGVQLIFASLGQAFGPVIGSLLYDSSGSYTLAFLFGGLAVGIGFLLIVLLKLPGTGKSSI